jgi:phosphoenolpyruvate-protein kinase (PTS system EI component)
VLVARRLLPSDTVFLSRSSTVGVLAEFAGPAAHAALLARELGIPCVWGIPDLLETVHTSDVVLVDGTKGTAVINPSRQGMQRLVAQYFIDDHPAILRLIKLVVREAGNTPVSICGELAGLVDVIPKLLRTGIRSLSVAAALVPDVKFAVRNIKVEDSENYEFINSWLCILLPVDFLSPHRK